MKDPTNHRFFVPIATAASVVISAISMTWYIAGLVGTINVRLAVLEIKQDDIKILIQEHIAKPSYSSIWKNTTP
jgi:ABC-type sugar transport system permease subunit